MGAMLSHFAFSAALKVLQ